MTESEIKREVAVAFEHCHLQGDWVEPVEDALAGITPEQALWKPGPDAMSIWQIVLHTAVWNENIVERVRLGEKVRPAEGDWPPAPEIAGEAAWEAAKERLRASLASIRDLIDATPLASLQGPYGLADLLCRLIHNGYHLGQIVKLRECKGW